MKPGLVTTLPAFTVDNDFQLDGTSTFERFAGGNGLAVNAHIPANGPYQIVDIYGLQGIGSPSDTLLAGHYILNNDINYNGATVTNSTTYWNGGNQFAATPTNGAGWVPIGEGGKITKPFKGVFDGNGFTVAGYLLLSSRRRLDRLVWRSLRNGREPDSSDGIGSQGIDLSGGDMWLDG